MRGTTRQRFWAKVDRSTDGCWPWRGATNKRVNGFLVPVFGAVTTKGAERTINAQRMAWILTHGRIRHGLFVLHNCDNPLCVRPDHLRLGTQAENMADMVERGRSGRGEKNSRAVLSNEAVLELRRRRAAGERPCDLAVAFNLKPTTCRNILRGQSYRFLPLSGGEGAGSVSSDTRRQTPNLFP